MGQEFSRLEANHARRQKRRRPPSIFRPSPSAPAPIKTRNAVVQTEWSIHPETNLSAYQEASASTPEKSPSTKAKKSVAPAPRPEKISAEVNLNLLKKSTSSDSEDSSDDETEKPTLQNLHVPPPPPPSSKEYTELQPEQTTHVHVHSQSESGPSAFVRVSPKPGPSAHVQSSPQPERPLHVHSSPKPTILIPRSTVKSFKLHKAKGSFPSSGLLNTCAVYDGADSVFILGGKGGTNVFLKDVLRYKLSSGQMKRVGHFPRPIWQGAAATVRKGTFLHFGGETSRGTEHGVYTFSTENPFPVKVDELPEKLEVIAVTSDANGKLFLLDGYNKSVHGYNFEDGYTGVVTEKLDAGDGIAIACVNGIIYGFGGSGDGEDRSISNTIFKFSTKTKRFKILDAELDGGFRDGAAVVVGTDIYVIGGMNEDGIFRFTRFDTLTETVEDLDVSNDKGMFIRPNAIYVPKSNRIYIFGGVIQMRLPNETIYYIQL